MTRPTLPRLLFASLLAGVVVLPAAHADAPTRYYIDGKRIPTPKQLPPVYPQAEQRRRIGGTVVVAFDFDADGKVTAATVKTSSGNKNLDQAALVAVRQWTIEPPVENGAPQAGSSETSLSFSP